MRLAYQLKLSAILIALLLGGCTSLQPRLNFAGASRSPQQVESRSRDGQPQPLPVELSGAVEKRYVEFNVKVPLLVW